MSTQIVNLSIVGGVIYEANGNDTPSAKNTTGVVQGGSIQWQIAPGGNSGIASIDSITAATQPSGEALFSTPPSAVNTWTGTVNTYYAPGPTLYDYTICVYPSGSKNPVKNCQDPQIKINPGADE
jgi:hypothetical protein